MKGTSKFIIELNEVYSETFKTSGGIEIFGNVNFTTERQSNRIVKVIGIPGLYATEIKEGYELLIDASDFYRQIYNGSKQWYQNIVDEERNLFHIEKDMIICYRADKDSEWKGFLDNSLVLPILEEKKIASTLHLPGTVSQAVFRGKVKMSCSNAALNALGVENGHTLFMDLRGGVKYWFEGIEYWWVRNRDLFAIEL